MQLRRTTTAERRRKGSGCRWDDFQAEGAGGYINSNLIPDSYIEASFLAQLVNSYKALSSHPFLRFSKSTRITPAFKEK